MGFASTSRIHTGTCRRDLPGSLNSSKRKGLRHFRWYSAFLSPLHTSIYMYIYHLHIPTEQSELPPVYQGGAKTGLQSPSLPLRHCPRRCATSALDFTLLMNIFPMSESLTWEYKVGVQERYESLLSQRRQSKLVGQQNPALPHWRCI